MIFSIMCEELHYLPLLIVMLSEPFNFVLIYFLKYKNDEQVVLWMNTVGPYYNQQETYSYTSLPFCLGSQKEVGHHHETIGEALQGVELTFSGIDIKFKRNTQLFSFLNYLLY